MTTTLDRFAIGDLVEYLCFVPMSPPKPIPAEVIGFTTQRIKVKVHWPTGEELMIVKPKRLRHRKQG